MRTLRSALVLLAAFALSLSFAVSAEDLPETAYDESESLSYEMTPLISAGLMQESARALQVVSNGKSSLPSESRRNAARAELSGHPVSDILTILDCALRC